MHERRGHTRLTHDRIARSRGPTALTYRAFARSTGELPCLSETWRAVNIELEWQAAACRFLLEVIRDAVLSVVPLLRKRGRIDGAEVVEHTQRRPCASPAVNAKNSNISPAEGVFHSASLPLADGRLRPGGVS